LIYETLEGGDVDKLVRGESLDRPKPLETRLVSPEDVVIGKERNDDGNKKAPPKPEPEPGVA